MAGFFIFPQEGMGVEQCYRGNTAMGHKYLEPRGNGVVILFLGIFFRDTRDRSDSSFSNFAINPLV